MRYEAGDWVRYEGTPALVQWVTSDGDTVGIVLKGERITREVPASKLKYIFKH